MKTRWYFIIAGAAVAGFAAWYQDFERKDSVRRAEFVAARALEQAAAAAQRRREDEAARADAIKAFEERRAEQAARAQQELDEKNRREDWQTQFSAVREENAALRVSRDRLARDVATVDERIAAQHRERDAIAAEARFLETYIAEAESTLERLAAVAERAVNFRIAQSAPPAETRSPIN